MGKAPRRRMAQGSDKARAEAAGTAVAGTAVAVAGMARGRTSPNRLITSNRRTAGAFGPTARTAATYSPARWTIVTGSQTAR